MPDCFENVNKSARFPKLWTMRKSRYEDAQRRMTSFSATESINMNVGEPERTMQLAEWTETVFAEQDGSIFADRFNLTVVIRCRTPNVSRKKTAKIAR